MRGHSQAPATYRPTPSADQDRPRVAEWAVVLCAAAVAVYSQYGALVNPYVINGDAPSAIYWLQRFREPGLFSNDLLTSLAVQMHGQVGFVLFYRAMAWLADPLLVSRFVPIVTLATFALYIFRLVRRHSTTFGGLFAAGLAMVVPTYLDIMAGGHQRSFAPPLLAALLYYVAIAAYRRACIVLALQALIYPMLFLVCGPVYVLGILGLPWLRGARPWRWAPAIWLLVVGGVCGALLVGKYAYAPDPAIGRIVTRAAMEGRPEYYAVGRTKVLPSEGLLTEVADQSVGVARSLTLGYPDAVLETLGTDVDRRWLVGLAAAVLVTLALGLIWAGIREVVTVPAVIPLFCLSGAAFYVLAELLLFRLYLPNRYLIYTLQPSALICTGIAVGGIVGQIGQLRVRRTVQVLLLALLAARLEPLRGIGLVDLSDDAPLYSYLRTLPRDAVIASHPDAADFIPTLSRRKVFVNFELSYPFFDAFWNTMTNRTRALFDAYYAEQRADIYRFCEENAIDYLVVRRRDFNPEYLDTHRVYFEPFNSYVRARLLTHRSYALAGITADEMLFHHGDTFVISKDVLAASAGRGPGGARDGASARE